MIHITEESARCLLCAAAPCGAQAARAIRALRFDNRWTAAELFEKMTDAELQAAENACIHYDRPIRFAELKQTLNSQLKNCSKLSTLNYQLNSAVYPAVAVVTSHAPTVVIRPSPSMPTASPISMAKNVSAATSAA